MATASQYVELGEKAGAATEAVEDPRAREYLVIKSTCSGGGEMNGLLLK
jgi:hypothetical protein